MTFLFAGFIAILTAITIHAVWSRREGLVRISAIVLMAVGLIIGWIALADLLGRPKPVSYETLSVVEADVLAASIVEDEAIYLWLGIDGNSFPMAYRLDWNRGVAEQLQKAQSNADRQGTGVKIRRPFEMSWDESDIFYAPPQPPMPRKIPERPMVMP